MSFCRVGYETTIGNHQTGFKQKNTWFEWSLGSLLSYPRTVTMFRSHQTIRLRLQIGTILRSQTPFPGQHVTQLVGLESAFHFWWKWNMGKKNPAKLTNIIMAHRNETNRFLPRLIVTMQRLITLVPNLWATTIPFNQASMPLLAKHSDTNRCDARSDTAAGESDSSPEMAAWRPKTSPPQNRDDGGSISESHPFKKQRRSSHWAHENVDVWWSNIPSLARKNSKSTLCFFRIRWWTSLFSSWTSTSPKITMVWWSNL